MLSHIESPMPMIEDPRCLTPECPFSYETLSVPTTADDSSRLTGFLLDLYGLSRSTPAHDFCRQAMDRLQRSVRFDSGLWATFAATAAGPIEHSRFLYNLPETMIEQY